MQNFHLTEHGEQVSVEIIKDCDSLALLCQDWLKLEVIALDTEFDRTNTYFHNLALLQIYDGKVIYLIDPLEIKDLTPLAEVCESKSLIKALHSCSEDLEALFNQYGFKFNSVFDTQIATAMMDLGLSVGYSRLIELFQGVSLDKSHTKTDWLQRPLSQEQLVYAAQDVQFLLPAYYKLRDKLLIAGHFDYVVQDAQSIFDAVSMPENYDHFYLRVKGAFKLNPMQTNRLAQVASWREQIARLKNIPRTFVFRDNQLIDLCLKPKPIMSDLLHIGCHRGSIRRYGSEILALIEQADKTAKEEWPEPVVTFYKLPKAKSLTKTLKSVAGKVAKEQEIPAELLSNKRLIEYYVLLKMNKPRRANRLWNSWRQQLLLESFEQCWHDFQSSS